jgi:uncharacterized membrane protein
MPRFSIPSTREVAGRALLAGFAAGLRSAAPTGVMATERSNASFRAGWKDWPLMRSEAGRLLLKLGWLGEAVTDKLPGVPPRIEPAPLSGRLVSGGIAGLAMGTLRAGADAKLIAVLAGVVGSLAGSYGGYAYRTNVAKMTGLPDLPIAIVEDIAAYVVAKKAITY